MVYIWRQTSRVCARSVSLQVRPIVSQTSVHFLKLKHSRQSSATSTSPKDAIDPAIDPALDPGAPAKPMEDVKVEDSSLPPFSSLKGAISYPTLKAITVKPFQLKTMTTVQAEVLGRLPQLSEAYRMTPAGETERPPPRDLLVKAKTGTGKTLAFLVPAIESRIKAIEAHGKKAVLDAGLMTDKHLESRARRSFVREHVGTLVISPTRELATQIANEALRLTHHHDDFEVRLFVGGVSRRMQMRDWMKGRLDIVVCTPGRMRDLLESEPDVVRGISHTSLLVLDEADTLLDMGFRDDIQAITEFLPPRPQRQTFLFSATVSRSIQQVARATLDKNHAFVNVETEGSSPVHAHVPQYHTVLPSAKDQIPHLLRLLAHDQLTNVGASKIILFLPTTKMTQLFATLVRELSKTVLPAGVGTRVYEIHSKRTQEARTSTSDAFRKDRSGASILVTSDISARGVDYPGVTRVIQVGIPGGTDQYIHRVGRTGRAGLKGRGDLVLLPWEIGFVTWQLTEVPLKPLTLNELKKQVEELAVKHDENPKLFFAGVPQPTGRYDSKGRPLTRNISSGFNKLVAESLGGMDESIQGLVSSLDEEAVQETFASLLGYYIAKSPELRMHDKGAIVQGIKDWTVQALGLPVPPYVSASFLQKLGVSDGRTKHFGRQLRSNTFTGNDLGEPSWMGRGQVRLRRSGQERAVPDWAKDMTEEDEDPGSASEFRGHRYGKGPARETDFHEMPEGDNQFKSGGRGDRGNPEDDNQFKSGGRGDRGGWNSGRGGDRGGWNSDRGGDRGNRDRGGGGGWNKRGSSSRGKSFGLDTQNKQFGGRVDQGEAGYGLRR